MKYLILYALSVKEYTNIQIFIDTGGGVAFRMNIERKIDMENKKNNKGLIITIIILIILFLGATCYICYDKGCFDKLLGKNELNQEEKNKDNKLSEEEIMNLYNSLVTPNKDYGLFFDRNISIEQINAYNLMPYIMGNYINDQNIDVSKYDYLSTADNSSLKNALSIEKNKIDEYIKNKFNINREFVLEENEEDKGYSYSELLDGMAYIYNFNDNKYYVGSRADGLGSNVVYSKYLRSEQDGDNLYIYTKAFVFTWYESGMTIFNSILYSPDNEQDYLKSVILDRNLDKYLVNNESVNEDLVFKDFDQKINTYKQTFKRKADGKYYWFSSEIDNNMENN